MKAKCPYCSKKISYGVRFMEKGDGEHICDKCKKPSNIIQNKNIWLLFAVTAAVSIIILMFYLIFGDMMQKAYDIDGESYSFFITMFFGKTKIIKWIIWELIPYLIFFFVSPIFIEFEMQKKYAGFTGQLNLNTQEFIPPSQAEKASSNTRVIPKLGVTKVDANHIFEDISSSSGNLDSTRSFNLKEDMQRIDPESYVKSQSYRSDAPLKKVEKTQNYYNTSQSPYSQTSQAQELYRVREIREREERMKLEKQKQEQEKAQNKDGHNYSANRRF